MFIEPKNNKGWIEVICGSMFSGKTEELIRRLKRVAIANQSYAVFKPEIETRYHHKNVVSHNNTGIEATPVSDSSQLKTLAKESEVIGIDEAQFFDDSIAYVCRELANSGKRIIVAGLDLDFKAQPFGPMPRLLADAEYVTKVHAICNQCGSLAQYTYRKSESTAQIELGEKDLYEARCRSCYFKAME